MFKGGFTLDSHTLTIGVIVIIAVVLVFFSDYVYINYLVFNTNNKLIAILGILIKGIGWMAFETGSTLFFACVIIGSAMILYAIYKGVNRMI